MKAIIQMGSVFVFGVAVGSVAILPTLNAQYRTAEAKELIRNETSCSGKDVTITLQESGPGKSGRHYHPGDQYSYVLEGSETRFVEGRPPTVAKVGDVIHEQAMEVGETQNDAPVRLLIVSIMEKGKPYLTRIP